MVPIATIHPFAGVIWGVRATLDDVPGKDAELLKAGFTNRESLARQGYLVCDGQAFWNRDPQVGPLAPFLQQRWGAGVSNGEYWFRVPDLRGLFLRGVSGDSRRDPDVHRRGKLHPLDRWSGVGNDVGSLQPHDLASHRHEDGRHSEAVIQNNGGGGVHIWNGGTSIHYTGSAGGSETRPLNVNVHYIIKAKDGPIDLEALRESAEDLLSQVPELADA